MERLYNDISKVVEKARKGCGLTHEDLAQKSENASAETLSHSLQALAQAYEEGRAREEGATQQAWIAQLANSLGLSSGALQQIGAGSYDAPGGQTSPLTIQRLTLDPHYEEHCYLLSDPDGKSLAVDPGSDAPAISDAANQAHLKIEAIVLTHGHADHSGAAAKLAEITGAPIYAHPEEGRIPQSTGAQIVPCSEGSTVTVGTMTLTGRATPGHTDGGITWIMEDPAIAFCGDVLFAGSVGNCFGTYSYDDQLTSIRKQILSLPTHTSLFPGHGPTSSVDFERKHNPFVADDSQAGLQHPLP